MGIINREAVTLGREGYPLLLFDVTTDSTASSSVDENIKP